MTITTIREVLDRANQRDRARQAAPPISPEPWDEEAEQLARAVADLNDELARPA